MIKAIYSRKLKQDYNFRGLESMDILVGSTMVGWHGAGIVAGSLELIHKHKTQRELTGNAWVSETSKLNPSDMPPSLPKPFHQLGIQAQKPMGAFLIQTTIAHIFRNMPQHRFGGQKTTWESEFSS